MSPISENVTVIPLVCSASSANTETDENETTISTAISTAKADVSFFFITTILSIINKDNQKFCNHKKTLPKAVHNKQVKLQPDLWYTLHYPSEKKPQKAAGILTYKASASYVHLSISTFSA